MLNNLSERASPWPDTDELRFGTAHQALQHHRRLWADELQRCQQTSKELEKARVFRATRDPEGERSSRKNTIKGRKNGRTLLGKVWTHWRILGKWGFISFLKQKQLFFHGETVGNDET